MMTSSKRPLILVSNDDGIDAPGVHELISRLVNFGDVIVVCPDSPQSGKSMAITVNSPLHLHRHPDYLGAQMWSVNGTPVDCIKLALHTLCRDKKPDLVASGINHGSNAAVNALYSGTMGAAFEACSQGIPAIGFSLTDHSLHADFSYTLPFVDLLVKELLENGLPEGVCLNVNVPNCVPGPTQIRLARSCKGNWSDEYELYHDPSGHPFYWLAGKFINNEPDATDTDEYLLHHGIATVVVQTVDRTDYPQHLVKNLQFLLKLK